MADADEKLQAKAEAATTGPWYLDGDAESEGHLFVGNRADGRAAGLWEIVHMSAEKMGRGNLGELTLAARSRRVADAAFIAAANPVVVLSLLDRLAAVEAERDQLRSRVDLAMTEHDKHTESGRRTGLSVECVCVGCKMADALGRECGPLNSGDAVTLAIEKIAAKMEQLRPVFGEDCDADLGGVFDLLVERLIPAALAVAGGPS